VRKPVAAFLTAGLSVLLFAASSGVEAQQSGVSGLMQAFGTLPPDQQQAILQSLGGAGGTGGLSGLSGLGLSTGSQQGQSGRNSDNQGCVDESISRYKKEPGFGSALSNSIFMQSCLDSSRPTPNFCTDVPKATEFMKSAQWRVDQCRKIDLSSDSYCQQLFQPVQQFCERGPRKSSENRNTNSY